MSNTEEILVSSREQTARVTTKVLGYFRFTRRCKYIATEVGVYKSDILAITPQNKLLEIEVKVSYNDFKNDFKKSYKRYYTNFKKHEVYANSANSKWRPNYFYYAVPESLVDKVVKYLKENKINYGVISVVDGIPLPYNREEWCSIVRKCKPLHKNNVSDSVINSIVGRMSSEVITRRQRIHMQIQKLKEKGD